VKPIGIPEKILKNIVYNFQTFIHYRSLFTYTRFVTELHVCLYACFEGYMLMILWCLA
jgi:hypothetical protein